jgi:hypothetical protein
MDKGEYSERDVNQDPTRITFNRRCRKEKNVLKESGRRIRRLGGKSNVRISKCISMWKNPIGKSISLEMRMLNARFRDLDEEINLNAFMKLKYSLDCMENILHSEKASHNNLDDEEDTELSRIEEITEEKPSGTNNLQ